MSASLTLSIFSIGLACLALGWNIYRDIILKPRVQTTIGVYDLQLEDGCTIDARIEVRATNFGPGEIVIQNLVASRRRLLNRPPYVVIIAETRKPGCDSIPARKSVGDTVSFCVPYTGDSFLGQNLLRVGLVDTFGRCHWARRKNLWQAKQQYNKDFGDKTLHRV